MLYLYIWLKWIRTPIRIRIRQNDADPTGFGSTRLFTIGVFSVSYLAKRQWLISFHKKADKHRWDVERYNQLQQGILALQADLRRIRAPIQALKPPEGEIVFSLIINK